MSTATKGKIVKYFSTHPNHQIIRVKPDERVMPNGKMVAVNMAEYLDKMLEFNDGWLEVREGENVLPTGPPDSEGNPTLEDDVQFLERQPSFGNIFHRQDDPVPAPTAEELERITDAVLNGDLKALRVIAEEELAGFERPEILGPIRKAAEKLAG